MGVINPKMPPSSKKGAALDNKSKNFFFFLEKQNIIEMQGIIKGKGFLVPRNDKIKDWTQRKSMFKKKVTKIFKYDYMG